MGLSNFINQGSSSKIGSGRGLSGFTQSGQNNNQPDYTARIGNAQQRLAAIGQPLPQEPNKNTVLDNLFGVLNYLNNKKNQGLSYLSGNKEAFEEDVSGADLLQQWGMGEGVGNQIAGFGFDLLTDPLNFLTFGAGGVASAAAKGGIKGADAAADVLRLGGKIGEPPKPPTVAKLGAFGKGIEIPGSGRVIGAVGDATKATTSKIGEFIQNKAPELARIGTEAKNLGGRLFSRGYGVPGSVSQTTKMSQDLFRMDTQDIVNEVTGMTQAWKGVDQSKILNAVEDPQVWRELNPAEVEAFNQVKDFFDINFLKAKEYGIIDEFRANYIPHIFKGKQEEIKDALEQVRRRGARMSTSSGFGKERNIMQDLATIMRNPELRDILKPETDLGKIMGIYKVSLQKAIRNKDMLDELTNLGPDVIRRIGEEIIDPATGRAIPGSDNIPDGWNKAPVQQLKGYAVPPDIARHLKDVLEPFTNSDSANKLFKLYDGVLGWWKGMATIPNPGFHIRNSLGNIFNNYLGGVRSLQPYKLAARALREEDSTLDEFFNLVRTRSNPDFSPSVIGTNLDTPGFNVPPTRIELSRLFDEPRFKEAMTGGDGPKIRVHLMNQGLDINMRGVKFLAKLQGVVGRGFISGDIADTIGDVTRRFKSQRNIQDFNPASRENLLFKAGEKVGTTLEDHSRIAHFIDRLQKGDTPLDAGLSVKKYLYDYTNLTPFEKNVLKRFIPFYAFTRFNLPLQLRELVKQPKYATVMGKFQDFMEALGTEITGQEVDEDTLPRYIRDLYSVRLPFQVGGRDVSFGVDVPIRDVNSIRPSEFFSMITPFITVPFEQAANRNVYFGRDLERYEGETVRAPGYVQGLFRMVQTLNPEAAYSQQFNQVANALGFTIGRDEDTALPEIRVPVRTAHILNQLVAVKNMGKAIDTLMGEAYDPFGVSSVVTGMSAVSNTSQQRELSQQYQEYQRLEDLLRKLRDEGNPAPTIRELEQQGGIGMGRSRGLSSFVGR